MDTLLILASQGTKLRVSSIRNRLRTDIDSLKKPKGAVMNRNSGQGHIRLVDVAKASGYSVSTVSVVLNDAPLSRKIAPSTRERVRAAAKRLGYHPDGRARALRCGTSDTVAVVALDILSPACMSIIGGVMEELHSGGYTPLLINIDSQPERLKKGLNLILEWRAGAIILITDFGERALDILAEIEDSQMPVVAIGSDLTSRNANSIVVDRTASWITSVHHLSKLGHKDVAFILSEILDPESEEEWREVSGSAAAMGLRLNPDLVLRLSALQMPEVRSESGRAFVESLVEKQKRFTAIVSFDDWAAAGAASELTHRSLRVPEDCSIIVVAHLISSTCSRPDLSVIRPDYRRMGKQAAQWASSTIRGHKQGEDIPLILHRHAPDLSLLSMSSIAPACLPVSTHCLEISGAFK